MDLKDIILKKGDVVYFDNSDKTIIDDIHDGSNAEFVYSGYLGGKIIKIERPRFETIYKASKEILDKEEKEYLEAVIRPMKENTYLLKKEFVNDSCYRIRISNNVKIDKFIIDVYPSDKYSFKGMEIDRVYTLKELGLFEE